MSATCRSPNCQASVTWVTTAAGNAMPLDPAPVEFDGSFTGLFVFTGEAAVRSALRTDTGPYFRSHYATCPDAKTFRRRRRGDA